MTALRPGDKLSHARRNGVVRSTADLIITHEQTCCRHGPACIIRTPARRQQRFTVCPALPVHSGLAVNVQPLIRRT